MNQDSTCIYIGLSHGMNGLISRRIKFFEQLKTLLRESSSSGQSNRLYRMQRKRLREFSPPYRFVITISIEDADLEDLVYYDQTLDDFAAIYYS